MVDLLTATDLDNWSGRRDAQAQLPTLMRRLIMATAVPSSIRIAAAEGVGSPGFDGVVEVLGGAPPFLPAGRSVWELGTGRSPSNKAAADYRKRTEQTSPAERATTTFVFVTSRPWDDAQAWAQTKADGSDGWASVVALDAQDLATWLETCPGVQGWLASECLGRHPFGITALRDWFTDWAERTEPAIPADLLVCGRDDDTKMLLTILNDRPCEHVIATRSRDEAVAFVAGALLSTPGPDDEKGATGIAKSAMPDAAAVPGAAASGEAGNGDAGHRGTDPDDAAHREALLERAVVVHDAAAWRRWITHEQPLILIPMFDEPTIDTAVRGGHHVLLPRVARPRDQALLPLHRTQARAVWERAGVGFPQDDELARAACRSLTSLRRRIGRSGRFRQPAWAESTSANLLAALLLAGSWGDDVEGDREVVVALADRGTWRSVARDLAPLTAGDDAPILERQHLWEFVDIVDAWDALSPALISDDLDVFHGQVLAVLTEPDPLLGFSAAERRALAFSREGLPQRRYSGHLRRGMANTLALLGAVAGDRVLPGGRTGEEHAATAVRVLLDDASSERWMSLADLLPVLAEAAPSVFLDAVEKSLRYDSPSIMALFNEQEDHAGLASWSGHTPLLWALETLAFLPQQLSRVAVALGQLAERDPGGRLANRPAESLQSILHLVFPQSVIDRKTRLQVLDAVRRATPKAGWRLLLSLIDSIDRGMLRRQGPRFRDWPRESSHPTYADIWGTLTELANRIADEAEGDRWTSALGVVDKVPPAGRERLLSGADEAWAGLDSDVQRKVLADIDKLVNEHARFRDAPWALNGESLQSLQRFLDEHAVPGLQPADHQLFCWWPVRPGMEHDTEEGRAALAAARADAVCRALTDGVDGLSRFAEQCDVPEAVGTTLAKVTHDLDEDVLNLLGGNSPHAHRLAHALARARVNTEPQWLRRMVDARPEQSVHLLLAADVDEALLSLLHDVPEERRSEFWQRVEPWRIPEELMEGVCEQLLAHDRPFSALWAIAHRSEGNGFPIELTVRAMRAPMTGTEERLDCIQSPSYVIGQVLDRLEEAGLSTESLADLEWWYLPALHHTRVPKALHRRLAADAAFFAELVTLVYKPDPSQPTSESADEEPAEEGHAPDAADDEQPTQSHVAHAAWNLLQEWRSPLPGSSDGSHPSSKQVQAWVSAAKRALTDVGRARIAPIVIGEALSGPAVDPDGTWPSEPVRNVLEQEQDGGIERALAIGRFNQRGVTVRGPYDGGDQERAEAARYRGWADKVRDDCPRAGAVLDGLAEGYEADARREDASAARQAEM